MKKIILGTVAGIAAGYFFRKIQEKETFKEMCDNINGLGHRAKRTLKDTFNKGLEEADCVKDQIETKMNN